MPRVAAQSTASTDFLSWWFHFGMVVLACAPLSGATAIFLLLVALPILPLLRTPQLGMPQAVRGFFLLIVATAFWHVVWISVSNPGLRVGITLAGSSTCWLLFHRLLIVERSGRSPLEETVITRTGSIPWGFIVGTCATTLLYLKGWGLLLPLVITNWIAVFLLHFRTRFRQIWLVSLVLPILGSFFSRIQLPDSQGFFVRSFDQLWRVSMAEGLLRFGWIDQLPAIGRDLRYHWLAESVVTLLIRLTASESLVVLSVLLPILLMFVAVICLIGLLEELSVSPRTAVFVAAVVILVTWEFYTIAIGYFVAAVLTIEVFRRLLLLDEMFLKPPYLVEVSVLLGLLTMSSVTSGIALAASVLGLLLYRLMTKRDELLKILRGLLILMAPLAVLSQTLLKKEEVDRSISVKNFLQFSRESALVEFYYGTKQPLILLSSLVSLSWLFLLMPGVLLVLFTQGDPRRSFKRLLMTVVIASIGLVLFFDLDIYTHRFLTPLLIIGNTGSLILIIRKYQRETPSRTRLVLTITLTVPVAYIAHLVLSMPFSRTKQISVLALIGSLTCLLGVAYFLLWAFRSGPQGQQSRLATSLLLVVSTVVTGSVVFRYVPVRNQATDVSAIVGSPEQRACSRWVRDETEEDSVLATNMFAIPDGQQKWFFVSATTRRQTVIDGPLYVAWWGGENWFSSRTSASTGFASSGSNRDLQILRQLGAEYFMLDKGRDFSIGVAWPDGVSTEFENDQCAILKLS